MQFSIIYNDIQVKLNDLQPQDALRKKETSNIVKVEDSEHTIPDDQDVVQVKDLPVKITSDDSQVKVDFKA